MTAASVLLSDDGFHAVETPLANELAGSAVNVLLMEIIYYRYEEICQSFELISDLTFLLRDIKSSHDTGVFASTPALKSDYHNFVLTVRSSVGSDPTDSVMEDRFAGRGSRKVVEDGFKMIMLDGRQRCGDVQ